MKAGFMGSPIVLIVCFFIISLCSVVNFVIMPMWVRSQRLEMQLQSVTAATVYRGFSRIDTTAASAWIETNRKLGRACTLLDADTCRCVFAK